MFNNNLTTGFRHLWKHRAFTLVNILGLAVGMTACFLIFLYVRFESSYDSFHHDADRIYRVVADIKTPTETIHADGPSWPMLPAMVSQFPEIAISVQVVESSLLVRKGDIKFQEEHSLFAGPSFFQLFNFPLLAGDPATALRDPFSIVFSESAAKKYFGGENPIGKTLMLAQKGWPVKVTGLMKDLPENSEFRADMIVSMSTETDHLNRGVADEWEWNSYHPLCFVRFSPGTDVAALEKRLPNFVASVEASQIKKQESHTVLSLEKLTDIHRYSSRGVNAVPANKTIGLFALISIFILLIACINFVNLATARAAERAKEVGIRKVVGARYLQLALQFLGESVVVCLVAFGLTAIFVSLLIPEFNQLAGKMISKGLFEHSTDILYLLGTSLAVSVLAGIYPALVLAAFKPTMVLKGRFTTGNQGNLLRKSLVVIQFSLSTGFIIATMVVHQQLRYMQEKDLGFAKDQLMIINTEGDPSGPAFQQSIKGIPGVRSTSLASCVPGNEDFMIDCGIENKQGALQAANLDSYFVDWDYIGQYQIRMAAGRAFDRAFSSDTTQSMIINETAAKLFGYARPEDAVGRRFKQIGREGRIIGVMKDFHYRSLQEEIKPLAMRIEPEACFLVSVKVATQNLPATIKQITSKWNAVIPKRPFLYYFLDEHFESHYRSEQRFSALFFNFTLLAILISCMGLFALSSYSTLQRTREVAVRKVMGASVHQLVRLLSGDFLKLVMIAFLIASPLAWWFMQSWLSRFAYRTTIGWEDFFTGAAVTVMIALSTIAYQSIRAATANPVSSLRSE
ncbi:MAG TPA: ABC transporter permease [Puia sp.]|nr:ABC transporter permease [Puia sp.]